MEDFIGVNELDSVRLFIAKRNRENVGFGIMKVVFFDSDSDDVTKREFWWPKVIGFGIMKMEVKGVISVVAKGSARRFGDVQAVISR